MTAYSDLEAKVTEATPDNERLKWWPIVCAMLTTALIGTGLGALPRPGQPVGLVFAPWTKTVEVFDRVEDAGGRVVDIGAVSWIAIAVSDDPDFSQSLRRRHGVIILDGALTSALCLPKPNLKEST